MVGGSAFGFGGIGCWFEHGGAPNEKWSCLACSPRRNARRQLYAGSRTEPFGKPGIPEGIPRTATIKPSGKRLGRRLCIKSNELLGPRPPFAEFAATPEPIQPISEAQPTRLVGKLRATFNVCRTSTFPKEQTLFNLWELAC